MEEKIFSLFSDAIFTISDAIFSFSFLPSLFKKIKNDFLRDDYIVCYLLFLMELSIQKETDSIFESASSTLKLSKPMELLFN